MAMMDYIKEVDSNYFCNKSIFQSQIFIVGICPIEKFYLYFQLKNKTKHIQASKKMSPNHKPGSFLCIL